MGDRQDLGKKTDSGGEKQTEGAARPEAEEKAAQPKAGDGENAKPEKIVRFDNKFFSALGEAYFSLHEESQDAVLVMNYGGMDAHLPLPGLKQEFNLDPDGHDAKMLDVVAEALHYVKVLPVGGAIPDEVLDGNASWEVSARHRFIAQYRLTMRLVAWLTGEKDPITDEAELIRLANDPATKEMVKVAFSNAAETLGLGEDRKEEVVDLITDFAEEMSYIEALRDMVAQIAAIKEKAAALEEIYVQERTTRTSLESVIRLLGVALKKYASSLDEVDAQTREIMTVLKNIDAQTKFVQETRNDLFVRLSAWGELIKRWKKEKVLRSHMVEKLILDTYHFLALRYLEGDEWALYSDLQKMKGRPKGEVIW